MKILAIGDFQGKFPERLYEKLKNEDFDLIIVLGDYFGIADWRSYFHHIFKEIKEGNQDFASLEEFYGLKKLKKIERNDILAGKKVLRMLDKLGKKTDVLYIFGNSDDGWYNYPFRKGKVYNLDKKNRKFLDGLKNMKDINYKKTTWEGISIVGFGGYMDPEVNIKHSKNDRRKEIRKGLRKTKKKLFSLMNNLKDEKIFVFHYPPYGVFDKIKERSNPYKGESAGVRMFASVINDYRPRLVLCGHMHEYQGMERIGNSIIVNPGDAERGKAAIIEYGKKEIKVRFIK